eukprot:TRINITY_DN121620_c0_g1_i1.p1 TRINITY_DN121620_c0_g1~~TRINITY_DN121620_c0_g1_i1.p1  ORF type:complete len:467 (+),score=36.74 TRINITY_DN121620_c0_g1_i1:148-1548(+)
MTLPLRSFFSSGLIHDSWHTRPGRLLYGGSPKRERRRRKVVIAAVPHFALLWLSVAGSCCSSRCILGAEAILASTLGELEITSPDEVAGVWDATTREGQSLSHLLNSSRAYVKDALLEEDSAASDAYLRRSNASTVDKASAAFVRLREPALKTLVGIVSRLASTSQSRTPSSFLLHDSKYGDGRTGDMLEVERGSEFVTEQHLADDPKEAEERQEKELYEARQRNLDIFVLCAFVVQELIALYVAFHVGEGIPDMTEEDERDPERYRNWSDRPLDCCAEPRLCCMSCLCPCVVFGMTAQKVGCEPLDQFWKGCVAFFLISLLAALVGLLGMILIGTLVFAVRRRLKEQFAFSVQGNRMSDFAFSCCCPILAIAQEARHLERSTKAGFAYTPSIRWPSGVRPRDGARGGDRRTMGPGLLAGPPVAVATRSAWEGDFRGACGSIGGGLVSTATPPGSDSEIAAKRFGV